MTTPPPARDAGQADIGADTSTDASKLAGGSAAVLIGGVGEQGLRVFTSWFLANALGPFTWGAYRFCITVLNVLGVFSPLGTDTGILYFGARHRAQRQRADLKGKLLAGLVVTTLGGIAAGAALWWGTRAGWFWPTKPDQANALAFVAPAVPFMALMLYAVGAVRAMKDMRSTALTFQLAFPLTTLVGAGAAVTLSAGLYGVLAAFMLSSAVALGFTGVVAWRWYGGLLRDASVKPQWGWRPLLRYSLPQGMAGAVYRLVLWTDTLLIMTLSSADQVGLYQAGVMWAMMGQLPVVAITTMFNPQVAELWGAGERERLERLLEIATRWLVVLAAPLYLGLLVAPNLVFLLYKSEYAPAASIMMIIVLGQVVHVVCTPAARLIPMTGHSFAHLLLAIGALAINVSMALVLIPTMGGRGAAIASAVTFASWALGRLAVSWWITRCFPFSRRTAMLLVGATVIGLLGHHAGGLGLPGGQVLPLIAVLLAFAGLVWVVGGTEDDKAALNKVKARLQRMLGRTG